MPPGTELILVKTPPSYTWIYGQVMPRAACRRLLPSRDEDTDRAKATPTMRKLYLPNT